MSPSSAVCVRAFGRVVSRDPYAISKKAKHGWVFNSNTK
jgi:hypothetical protein